MFLLNDPFKILMTSCQEIFVSLFIPLLYLPFVIIHFFLSKLLLYFLVGSFLLIPIFTLWRKQVVKSENLHLTSSSFRSSLSYLISIWSKLLRKHQAQSNSEAFLFNNKLLIPSKCGCCYLIAWLTLL